MLCASARAAGTLLSGYGAPGAGEQAILGSRLLNTPRSSSGGVPESVSEGPAGSVSATLAPLSGESHSGPHAAPPTQTARARPGVPAPLAGPPGSSADSTAAAVSRAQQVSYDSRLGLSGDDMLAIALAACVLLALAAFTRRLTRLER